MGFKLCWQNKIDLRFFEFGLQERQQRVVRYTAMPGLQGRRPRLSTSRASRRTLENRLVGKSRKSGEADKGQRAQARGWREETQQLGGAARHGAKIPTRSLQLAPHIRSYRAGSAWYGGRRPPPARPPLAPNARTHARTSLDPRAEGPKSEKRMLAEAPPRQGLPAGGFGGYAVPPSPARSKSRLWF